MKRHHISVMHALDGVVTALKTQPNFRVHIIFSSIALFLSWFLEISSVEWAIVVCVIVVGLAIELINTSIEFTVDLITQERHTLAKYAKDTAAAAMLMYACGAVVIGIMIFLPKVLSVWRSI